MIIKNALVFLENGQFKKEDVCIKNGIIVPPKDVYADDIFDADGLYLIPGLIDIHSHGAMGHDFCDADLDGLKKMLSYQKSCGITSYCPTSMTLPKDRLLNIFSVGAKCLNFHEGADIIGFNMEGPFIDPKKIGAQNPNYVVDPNVDFFLDCQKSSNYMIKFLTISPHSPGTLDFIKSLNHDDICISLGHTSSDYDTAKQAFLAGANHVTHLYNAMPPLLHRDPGIIGAAFESDCMVELICDGMHVHPCVIKSTFSMFKNRVVLISDSMMATGMPDGNYHLGDQRVFVKDNLATLENGSIAGSSINLFKCMQNAISFGIPPKDAILAATANPAKCAGIYSCVGSISINKKAHLLALDKNFNLVKVFK